MRTKLRDQYRAQKKGCRDGRVVKSERGRLTSSGYRISGILLIASLITLRRSGRAISFCIAAIMRC